MLSEVSTRPDGEARYTNSGIRPAHSARKLCEKDGVVIVRRRFALSNPDHEIQCDPVNRRDMLIHVEFTHGSAETANGTPIFHREGMRHTNQWQWGSLAL